jgi:hypothetical protein
MITTFILVVVALGALGFFIWALRGQSRAITDVRELPLQTRPIDVAAFRNLVDPGEEEFLRTNLGAREFTHLQRKRTLAVIAYVRCAAQNASVLLRVGEAARRSPDPEVALAAQQLVSGAIRLRLYAALALVKLYPATLVPGAHVSPTSVLDAYQQLTSVVSQLTRLQHPARTTRISASL